jgi:branched-chain amino acid transport system substrate-binding protein
MKLFKASFQLCLILVFSSVVIPNAGASIPHGEEYQAVKIGLLIPDNKSIAAQHGAELAVRNANIKGGLNEIPFQLVTLSMEGPWGTGSKQAAKLIFEEKVWALLGSHDGRNAHLAEQAATKTQVVFVSAWAGDPTLSQAFVPWFFNCVPNDIQQAQSLIEEIYNIENINKIVTVSDNDYDSQLARKTFLKQVSLEKKAEPVQFLYEDYSKNINNLLDQIKNSDAGCIILFCKPAVSLDIFNQVRQVKMDLPVFGSVYLLNENELSDQQLQNYNNDLLITSANWSGSKYGDFCQKYKELYGKNPGMVAAYAFDAMNILIEAIRSAGKSDRELIQKSLQDIRYEGVTGPVSFDSKGNRLGTYFLSPVKNGIPVMADK